MVAKTFVGGVHPDEKKISSDKPIENLPAPKTVIIPVSQHIGAPSKLIVKKGDQVKKGTLIAESGGFVSVPQHSSVSGEVKKITDIMTPMGTMTKAVEIESDEEEIWEDEINFENPIDYNSLSPKELIEKVQKAGIVGMGGAAFPTHVKLSPPPDKKIKYLLINGAECEPYLTCDYRLMLEKSEELIEGIKILQKILNEPKAFIGIEMNKPEAIQKLQSLCSSENNIEVIPLKVKYPQGDEKQLIKAICSSEVPSGGLPMDVGVVVQNVGTTIAVLEAVKYNKPLIDRVLTITGQAINEAKNVFVPIGTNINEIIDFAGGYKSPPEKLINGGPMMGFALYTSNFPVMKGTSGILALTADEADTEEEIVCIRCGKCVDVCPQRLVPALLGSYSEYKMWDKVNELSVMDCKECGSCGYICPSKRKLVHLIKFGKQEVRKLSQK